MMQAVIALSLILCLISATSVAFAETSEATEEVVQEVSAEAMIVDLFLLRPVGFAATIVGSAVWVLALPFTLPTKSNKKAAEKLVVEPAKYTFSRRLGQN
jgi:hypothetical protein